MIKGAEKRGKVHTTPIAAREREEGELRQAQGSLAGERTKGGGGGGHSHSSISAHCASDPSERE